MSLIENDLRQAIPQDGARRAVVSRPEERTWISPIPGEQLSIRVHSRDVAGGYAIVESIAAPGTGTPLHYHREDEVFHILEGVLTLRHDGRTFEAQVGTTVVIPAGAHHAWKNCSSAPARMLVTLFPGGVEELFQRLAVAPPEDFLALVESYGSHIVGPPIEA